MTRRSLTALAALVAIGLVASSIGHAQTFKVEKFDIKGEGARTMSPSKPPRDTCSFRAGLT
jgi:hypothetical protein